MQRSGQRPVFKRGMCASFGIFSRSQDNDANSVVYSLPPAVQSKDDLVSVLSLSKACVRLLMFFKSQDNDASSIVFLLPPAVQSKDDLVGVLSLNEACVRHLAYF